MLFSYSEKIDCSDIAFFTALSYLSTILPDFLSLSSRFFTSHAVFLLDLLSCFDQVHSILPLLSFGL